MIFKVWFLFLVFTACSCNEGSVDVVESCAEDGDCAQDDGSSSLADLFEMIGLYLPFTVPTLLVALVCVAFYCACALQVRASLPWRLYRPKSCVEKRGRGELYGDLRDVELLRMRLDAIERERDELKAILENKQLVQKQSEVDLAIGESRRWEETVNSLQRKPAIVTSSQSEYGRMTPSVSSFNSDSSSDLTVSKKRGGARKAPSLPSKAKLNSGIPMPSKPVQFFSSADYARKCREMLAKLNESEKKVAKLTEEVDSGKKMRDEFTGLVEQRNSMGRKIAALTREKKDMAKQVVALQAEIKTAGEQFDDVRKQNVALSRQFDLLNMNTKTMARDKRLLNRQLVEAKEELEFARDKLDGIHREKSRLVETIEQMDLTRRGSLRTVQTQAPKSNTDFVRKTSSSHPMPFKNRFNFVKQRNFVGEQNEVRRSSQALIKMTTSKQKTVSTTTPKRTAMTTAPKSSVEVIHKLAKGLGDKCKEFAKQNSFAKDLRDVRKTSKSASTTPVTQDQLDVPKQDKLDPGTKGVVPQSKEKGFGDDNKETVKTKSMRKQVVSVKSRKDKSVKDIGAKSSIDITEFARSLQKLERNVEINMKIRASNDPVVEAGTRENKAIMELYHNNIRSWESRTEITPQASSCTTVSEIDTSYSELDVALGSDAHGSAEDPSACSICCLDSCCSVCNAMDCPLDHESCSDAHGSAKNPSACSICCLDSCCSVCNAVNCPLDHKSCSDVNCLATCSSCSIPVEFSQSIGSCNSSIGELDNESRPGLAAIFGNGPVGEGGPWNLPGLSGIMTRTTRPTGSVLACQGSLGEVGDMTSLNDFPRLDEDEEVVPHIEGAKKRLSRFTANDDDAKRVVSGSPAFRQFLQELTTLVQGKEKERRRIEDDEDDDPPILEQLLQGVTRTGSQETFVDSEESLEMTFSQSSTQYFVNNDKEPIF